MGIFLYHKIKNTLISSVDNHLKSDVQLIAGFMDAGDEDHEIELAEISTGKYSEPLSGDYYQVVKDGEIIVRSPSLAIVDAKLPMLNSDPKAEFKTIVGPGKRPLRVLNRSYKLISGFYTIQAGEPLEYTYEVIGMVKNLFLLFFPSLFLILIFGVFIIVTFSLKKLNSFSNEIGQITEEKLSKRIKQDGLDLEIQSVANNFNSMIDRIEEAFDNQKDFLSNASHELRTPVAVIKSHCDIALSKERNVTEYKSSLNKINMMVNRITNILNQILRVSRLDSDSLIQNKTEYEIFNLLEDTIKIIEPTAHTNFIKFTLSGDMCHLVGDKDKIVELFITIMDNAIKYNKQNGTVDIIVRKKDNYCIVQIKDSGIGISELEIKNIFKRFYRSDETRNKQAGSGLGLSIASEIIRLHNGKIDVRSEIGSGSIFEIYLPVP